MAKAREKFFQFLKNMFKMLVKISAVIGAMLVVLGGTGLYFAERYQDKILCLIFSLVGYVLIASSSFFGLAGMKQREIK